MKRAHTRALVLGAAGVLTLAKLVLAATNPYHYRPLSPHDDQNYVQRAVGFLDHVWVGDLTQYTFMRGPVYAAYLALVGASGLPLSVVDQVLFVAATAFAAREFARFAGRDRTFAAAIYIGLLLYPYQETWSGSHVIRDNLSFAAVLAGMGLGVRAVRLKTLGALAWFSALAAVFVVLREDSIWISPALGLVLFTALRPPGRRWWRSALSSSLVISAVVLPPLAVAALNASHGLRARTIFDDTAFARAHAALARYVDDDTSSPFTFTLEMQEHVADSSPTYRLLAPAMNRWRRADGIVEIDRFRFGFADGLYDLGVIGDRASRSAVLDRLADELRDLCLADARPSCRSRAGPVPLGVVRARDVWAALQTPVREPGMALFADHERDDTGSDDGPVDIVRAFEQVTNQRAPGPRVERDGVRYFLYNGSDFGPRFADAMQDVARVALPALRALGLAAALVLLQRRRYEALTLGVVLVALAYVRAVQVALATRFNMAYYGHFYLHAAMLLFHAATVFWLVSTICEVHPPLRARLRSRAPRP